MLDPFEAGLDPDDVEVRFRALRFRFHDLADVAPPELRRRHRRLGRVASTSSAPCSPEHGYDFGELAASEAGVAAFDDPAFADIAAGSPPTATQVCVARCRSLTELLARGSQRRRVVR